MRVLALDIGDRRIGIAVSDPTGLIARPLRVLERRSKKEDFAVLSSLVSEYGVERVVVGRPLTPRGRVGQQARRAEGYAQALAEVLSVPVELWDERYTTVAAEEILRGDPEAIGPTGEAGRGRRCRSGSPAGLPFRPLHRQRM